MPRPTSRRSFLRASAAAGAGITALHQMPHLLRAQSSPSANEKVNVAFIGVGGKGADTLATMPKTDLMNVVALCDVDENTLNGAAKKFPSAKLYRDYRRMLDDPKGYDAVVVTIPDNHHAYASVMAMQLGKHVYCEKPLTHDVYEARLMRETAAKYKLATQMGNSGHAGRGVRSVVDALHAGVIGNVTEAHAWTDRPIWPQGIARPTGSDPVPATLDWDMRLGPAPFRPFVGKQTYHPFVWRGWWDFGTGALGDMACHIVDSIFWGLDLESPTAVEAEFDSPHNDETAPLWSIVRWTFPGKNGKPVKVSWYDGGKLPPEELSDGRVKMGPNKKGTIDNGVLLVGDKGRLVSDRRTSYKLLPEKDFKGFEPPPAKLPQSPGHHQEWLLACKGAGPAPMSNFDYASRLTEMVLLGNVAIRAGKRIEWDAANMKVTNAPEAQRFIKREYRKGWTL